MTIAIVTKSRSNVPAIAGHIPSHTGRAPVTASRIGTVPKMSLKFSDEIPRIIRKITSDNIPNDTVKKESHDKILMNVSRFMLPSPNN